MGHLFLVFLLISPAPSAIASTEPAASKAVVFAKQVKASELYDLLVYPARVVPKVNTTILSETDGVVTKILAPLGQKVSRGQKLIMITHTDPVYEYAPVSVKAPVSGIVSLVEVTEGSQVAKGERLASVTDPTKIRITVEIPAQDLSNLSQGIAGEFQMDSSAESLPVRIHGISPFVDPATGTATCEIELEKRELKGGRPPLLVPGVIGQVSFKTGFRKGISIPDDAIFYRGDATFVRVIENGRAKEVVVKLGKKQEGSVEIVSGLSGNPFLVERTSRFVSDGEAVTVQNAEDAAGAGGAGR